MREKERLAESFTSEQEIWSGGYVGNFVDIPNRVLSELSEGFVEKFQHHEHSEHRLWEWTPGVCDEGEPGLVRIVQRQPRV